MFQHWLSNQVEIGQAGSHVERCAPFPNGAFNLKPARQRAQTQQAMKSFEIALLDAHVNHARQARPIAGGKGSAIEVDAAHHVWIDRTHITPQVLGIVDGGAVERDIVLVVVATAHKDAGAAFGARLHAWQFLNGFKHIGFAQKYGGRQNLLLAERQGAHLR